MKIALGSDHAGFKLKEHIKGYLRKMRIPFSDLGTFSEESCDYPDFGYKVAKAVAQKKFTRGILFCGSAVGMGMVANKVKGIRAVAAYDLYTARMSREHNDANVLCLAERRTSPALATRIVNLWLKTKFAGGRHRRRVRKIER